ncbi:hypothetical protein TNCT_160601 [Trichonephila clavata]|uniref:Uncharacterized protein n=1 Tax=Trichonephila clavata TaxID=2740835 RepID=A0A8X6FMN1_TRICU|nr:hypothetical protein TNCT_160601 [Trichonephila clavata]
MYDKMMVTYLCDSVSKRCWLTENPDNYIKFIIPMALFGHNRIPIETKLDNISKLFSREKREIYNHSKTDSPRATRPERVTTKSPLGSNPDFLRRRKREAPSPPLYRIDDIQSESKMASDTEQFGRNSLWREKREDNHSNESEEMDQSTEETDTRAQRQQMKRSAPTEDEISSQTSDATDANYNSDESSTPESSEQKRTPQHEELYRAQLNDDDEDDNEVDPALFLSKVDPMYKVARSNSLNYRSLMDDDDVSGMYYGYGDHSHYSYPQSYYKGPSYFERRRKLKPPMYSQYAQMKPKYYQSPKKAMASPYHKNKYGNRGYKPPRPAKVGYGDSSYGELDNDLYYG